MGPKKSQILGPTPQHARARQRTTLNRSVLSYLAGAFDRDWDAEPALPLRQQNKKTAFDW